MRRASPSDSNDGNMHDAPGCGTFTIEGIELPAYSVLEISRGHTGALKGLLALMLQLYGNDTIVLSLPTVIV